MLDAWLACFAVGHSMPKPGDRDAISPLNSPKFLKRTTLNNTPVPNRKLVVEICEVKAPPRLHLGPGVRTSISPSIASTYGRQYALFPC